MGSYILVSVEGADQRFENLESRTGQVEAQVHSLKGS